MVLNINGGRFSLSVEIQEEGLIQVAQIVSSGILAQKIGGDGGGRRRLHDSERDSVVLNLMRMAMKKWRWWEWEWFHLSACVVVGLVSAVRHGETWMNLEAALSFALLALRTPLMAKPPSVSST